jgi:molecular chaperone GrpE
MGSNEMRKEKIMTKEPLSSEVLKNQKVDENLQARVAELEQTCAELKTTLEEKEAMVLRTLASKENAEKRMQKQVSDAHAYALQKFCEDLLPIMDSLQKATETCATADDVTREGIEMTKALFEQTFERHQVETINPKHEPFNPEWHAAISTLQNDAHPDQLVLEVMQIGYRLKERLLRPALVVVNRIG